MQYEQQAGGARVDLPSPSIDTGMGLNKEQQGRLFQEFVQAAVSTSRKFGGTGLGLSICKQLVELMEGEIGIDSQPGEGSTFWFSLPLALAFPIEESPPVFDQCLSGLHMLLLDDNAHYLDVSQEYLSAHGIALDTAMNDKQALAMIQQKLSSDKPYDLIAIDMDMPDSDGIAFAKALKQQMGQSPYLALLLTSPSHLPMHDEYQQLNIALSAHKPILAHELFLVFSRALGKIVTPAPTLPCHDKEMAGHKQALHILLVEDNDVNYQVASTMLHKQGHEVLRAENGRLAIEAFKSHHLPSATKTFDVILMDCEMPEMDGFQASMAIRRLEKKQQLTPVPILALTSHASSERMHQCTEAGMTACLSKPIRSEALNKALREYTAGT